MASVGDSEERYCETCKSVTKQLCCREKLFWWKYYWLCGECLTEKGD
jgi:hypothetical protein